MADKLPKTLTRGQIYYAKNRERLLKKANEHYHNNRERVLASQNEYARSIPSVIFILRRRKITLVNFLAALHYQDDCCAICRTPFSSIDTKLNPRTIEHCHTTNRFRGVTCPSCNLMLGHAKDNPQTLQNGIRYLKEAAKWDY